MTPLFFLLQAVQHATATGQPGILENFITTLLASGILLSVCVYFYVKNEKNRDDRIARNEAKAQKAIEKAEKIEKNYIQRFEEVHEKIDETATEQRKALTETAREIVAHIDRKMEKVSDRVDRLSEEKNTWRLSHTEKLTAIQQDVKHLTEEVRRSNH